MPSVPEGESWKFYYYAGSARIAMRLKNLYGEQVYYFFSDHLGSTNVITDPNGNVMSETLYKAWGEMRYSSGSSPTDFTFTGQRSEMDDIGLMFYNARFYDPELGRFTQPDTIVPGAGNPVAYDRYAYVVNNPINLIDPSGHDPEEPVYLYVNLASSIPENFWDPWNFPSAAQSQVDFDTKGRTLVNLCGDVALSMIFETTTGFRKTLQHIYKARPIDTMPDAATSAYQLAQQFAGAYQRGWEAIGVSFDDVFGFRAGGSTHQFYDFTSQNGASNITSAEGLCERLVNMLTQGHYVIALVTQLISDPTGAFPGLVGRGTGNSATHWIVVTGINSDNVYINNPYTNRRESYSRNDFYASWSYAWVELIPPPRWSSQPPAKPY